MERCRKCGGTLEVVSFPSYKPPHPEKKSEKLNPVQLIVVCSKCHFPHSTCEYMLYYLLHRLLGMAEDVAARLCVSVSRILTLGDFIEILEAEDERWLRSRLEGLVSAAEV